MQKAYLHFIKYALKRGHTISVFDSELWSVKKSTSFKEIKENVEAVDAVVQLRVRDKNGEYVCTVAVILEYDQAPDETIADFTVCKFMDDWEQSYHVQ